MRKFIGLLAASAVLLGACEAEPETPNPDTNAEANVEENQPEESMTEDTETEAEITDEEIDSDNAEDETETDTDTSEEETDTEEVTDQDVDLSIVTDQDFEEINWDEVHLTREEFDSILYEMQDDFNADYEADADTDVTIDSVDFSGDTIEITLTNNDDSEFADMTNGLLATFLDGFYRQLYLHSDYSDGTTHPRIIVQTSNGEVITDQKDFLEFEE